MIASGEGAAVGNKYERRTAAAGRVGLAQCGWEVLSSHCRTACWDCPSGQVDRRVLKLLCFKDMGIVRTKFWQRCCSSHLHLQSVEGRVGFSTKGENQSRFGDLWSYRSLGKQHRHQACYRKKNFSEDQDTEARYRIAVNAGWNTSWFCRDYKRLLYTDAN